MIIFQYAVAGVLTMEVIVAPAKGSAYGDFKLGLVSNTLNKLSVLKLL
jgi:hypothetical protein